MLRNASIALVLLLLAAGVEVSVAQASSDNRARERKVEDFEAYAPGDIPHRWQFLRNRRIIPLLPEHLNERENFYIVQEGGRKFVRAYTEGESQHIILVANDGEGGGFGWDLEEHPRLTWQWRALELPVNAREDKVNDTGAAVYVTFGADWLGRPKSIKYTYSSTLPVGSVVSFGPLRVLVVDSGIEGTGKWKTVDRDVIADYRQVFGEEPPNNPLSITLWSDSDNTKTTGKADFDNIRLLPPRQ